MLQVSLTLGPSVYTVASWASGSLHISRSQWCSFRTNCMQFISRVSNHAGRNHGLSLSAHGCWLGTLWYIGNYLLCVIFTLQHCTTPVPLLFAKFLHRLPQIRKVYTSINNTPAHNTAARNIVVCKKRSTFYYSLSIPIETITPQTKNTSTNSQYCRHVKKC